MIARLLLSAFDYFLNCDLKAGTGQFYCVLCCFLFWSRPLGCDHHGFPDAPFEHQASLVGLFKKQLSGVRLLS